MILVAVRVRGEGVSMSDNDEVGKWAKERAAAQMAGAKAFRSPKPCWQSRQVPGTPVTAETLFILIREGQTESFRFRLARAWYAGLTDEEVWAAYQMWDRRQGVHEALAPRAPGALHPVASAAPVVKAADSLFGDEPL